jgi:DNA mismatch repair protein MutL
MRVTALLAPTTAHRSSAKGSLYMYVNGRYVRDPVVRKAIAQAYRDRLPRGRYPVAVVHVELPKPEVDVNVHPSKTEVRFVNPRDVMGFVTQTLESALGSPDSPSNVNARNRVYEHPTSKLPFGPSVESSSWNPSSRTEAAPTIPAHPDDVAAFLPSTASSANRAGEAWRQPGYGMEPSRSSAPAGYVAESAPSEPRSVVSRSPQGGLSAARRVVGAVLGRYAVCEDDAGLLIVDIFAVRQALAVDQMERDRAGFLGDSRPLLMPVTVDLEGELPGDMAPVFDQLEEIGFDLSLISPRIAVVKRVPRLAADVEIEDWVQALLAAALNGEQGSLRAVESELARLWSHQDLPLDSYEVRTLLASSDEIGLHLDAPGIGLTCSLADLARLIKKGSM